MLGGTYTMTAEEAAELVNTIKPRVAVPIHYGSIVGTKQDTEVFKNNLKQTTKSKMKQKVFRNNLK